MRKEDSALVSTAQQTQRENWEVVDAEYGIVVRLKTTKNLIKELESSESGAVSNIFLKALFSNNI